MNEKKNEMIKRFNETRENIIRNDRRFNTEDDQLLFEEINLTKLSKKYPTPLYVFSEREILRNIKEINDAFLSLHNNTKIFYASKACSVMGILKVVKESCINIETNSLYEIKKALEIGFSGNQIIYNGVVKKREDLEYAIKNSIYQINIDSFYELQLIKEVSERLQKDVDVCIRIEPNVPSPTHPSLVTAYHAKSGIDIEDAEKMAKEIVALPYVHLKGLHMHVGDQIPTEAPFREATRILVDKSASIEQSLGIQLSVINVGGGIPVTYRYGQENNTTDYLSGGITAEQFAKVIVEEVHKWKIDVEILLEPGRKIVSSAALLLTTISADKTKNIHNEQQQVINTMNWKFVDAGYNVLPDSLHFQWYFHVLNSSKVKLKHDFWCKIAGPLCDGGDYFHQGVNDEFYLLPSHTEIGDILVFFDTGAYTIESQTVYNARPRTPVILITEKGDVRLIRREDTYEDLISCDIY